ncbi:virulence RhuM family protein [Testudinibacter sp. TR-2022]|nr:virulence RhuM family protein [Pasteurellaceae bacterium Phil31]TNH07230.1 virulence RhuM family protein [Testudinibacter sp. TR-2022]TNH12048.1 virulence RhuM family protein [Testudinibacter sp. TR-2022]TNH15531.1 virulence RhuM family protein [Testudinibacter sp. TR-2022]TNH15635.1 virulence RhuM family protein [Testudinibacter sp. TR-2022]
MRLIGRASAVEYLNFIAAIIAVGYKTNSERAV